MLYRSKATSSANAKKIRTSNVWRCPKLMHLQNPLEPGSGLDSNPSSTHSKPLALNWKSKDKFDPHYELPQGQQLVTHGFELAPVLPQVFQAVIPAIERIPAHRTLVRCFGRCGKIPKRKLQLSVKKIHRRLKTTHSKTHTSKFTSKTQG